MIIIRRQNVKSAILAIFKKFVRPFARSPVRPIARLDTKEKQKWCKENSLAQQL